MNLAIFDLDNTLIAGDSDCLWGEFLIELGKVDADTYRAGHEKYYEDYLEGKLDIHEFLAFQLSPLASYDYSELHQWREQYVERKIRPILLPLAHELVEKHRQQQHELLIITATNRFLTEPIATIFGIDHLIACEPEVVDGQFTGKATGVPSYAEGKVSRYHLWLDEGGKDFEETWFYSDSHNDIPLLGEVDHPVAVDPDATLLNEARREGWEIISLRK